MALKQIFIIGSLLATYFVSNATYGQVNVPSPKFQHKAVESPDSTRPFATPGVFDYDTQVWAPVEFTNGDEMKPNEGFYATIDKVYTSVSKAGNFTNATGAVGNSTHTGSNYIWGTRLEMGWMSDADDGWAIAYQHADGIYYTSGQDILVSNPELVKTAMATVEINKMFRQTLKQGGYFEPYVGGRFTNLSDNTIEDTFQLLNGNAVTNRFKQNTTNDAFGFQAGARYNHHRGRWRTTTDGALALAYNQQRYFATDIATSGGTQAIIERYDTDQAFLPVLDFQLELAYHVSRDIALRGGVQAMYLWDGIARANTQTTSLNPNSAFSSQGTAGAGLFDDNFIAAGFIFGLEWRR